MDSAPIPLALYFHWPFCLSKCTYCAFNSIASPPLANEEEKAWVRALIASLEWHVQHVLHDASSYTLQSIFFGGGTSSLLTPPSINLLVERVCVPWPVNLSSVEITVEANPDTITPDRLKALSQAGINRLSLGIQALNDKDLACLGRTHSLGCARQAVSWVKDQFENYNLDFIYKRPKQSLKMWKNELEKIFAFNSPHLSLYELTIEPGTLMKRHARQAKASPQGGRFLDLTLRLAEENGYTAYEISNFCKQRFSCKHNLAYWQYQDYLGIGPGAHSRIRKEEKSLAITAFSNLSEWRSSVAQDLGGLETKHCLSLKERLMEHLLMGLRVKEGIPWQQLEDSAGTALVRTLRASPQLKILQEQDILISSYSGIAASPKGRLLIDGIADYLDI